jgi:Icc-related predicted phosphoesterase
VPYIDDLNLKRDLLLRGRTQSKDTGLAWLVLHHIPPPWHWTADSEEATAGVLLNEFQPDYFFSGHLHELPLVSETGWKQQVGPTLAINAGQSSEGLFPNHIVLDLHSREIIWRRP